MRSFPLIVNHLSFGINDALQIWHFSHSHSPNWFPSFSIAALANEFHWRAFAKTLFQLLRIYTRTLLKLRISSKNSHIEKHSRTERLFIEISRRQELSIECRSDQNIIRSQYPIPYHYHIERNAKIILPSPIETWDSTGACDTPHENDNFKLLPWDLESWGIAKYTANKLIPFLEVTII